ARDCRRPAHGQLRRPSEPGALAVGALKRAEQRVLFKPTSVGAAKALESRALARAARALELGERAAQARRPESSGSGKIGARGCTATGRAAEVASAEQADLAQALEAEQQRASRHRRERLVGRAAEARRPDREHLPPALACGDQGVEEVRRRSAKVA